MNAAFQELMAIRNRPDGAEAEITGADPVFSTRFKVAETGAGILAAVGVAVSDIWAMKTGRRQRVAIDVRHAGAALNSFSFLQARRDDGSYQVMGNSPAATANYQITQPFATKDGRWFLPHFGIAHLKERVLGVLQCEATPEAVARAVGQWDAQALEDAIAEVQACGGMIRTSDEWLAHPQGQALAVQAVVAVGDHGCRLPEHEFAGHAAPTMRCSMAHPSRARASASLSSMGSKPELRAAAIMASLLALPLPVAWRLMVPTGTAS